MLRSVRAAAAVSRAAPLQVARAAMATMPATKHVFPPELHSSRTGDTTEKTLRERAAHCFPAPKPLYAVPLNTVYGRDQWLFDDTGKRYLDCFAGVVTVGAGHCHPKINKAAFEQMERLWHTTHIYVNPNYWKYADKLTSKMPEGSGLSVAFFCNSGTEANDLALLLAREYTGNRDVISLRNGYHGAGGQAYQHTSLSTWKFDSITSDGVKTAVCPDPYRGIFRGDPDRVKKYADDVKSVIEFGSSGKVAGFIAETIQGVGGTIPLEDGYLKLVYEHVRKAGGICIADEVQGGFGRTGDHYWSFERHGVTPDIVTMAKSIGNGYPMSAVVTRPEIAAVLSKKAHFNTYGGNPVACAVGMAVLDVIDEEKLQERAKVLGKRFLDGLEGLKAKHTIIGDVRGRGMLLGVELVKDRDTLEPAPAENAQVHQTARDKGLLVGKGGLHGSCLRIKPPLCLNEEDVDFAIEVLDESFSAL